MILPLQAIIGYGTKATIYSPSTLQLFNTLFESLRYQRTLLAPWLPPLTIPHFPLYFLPGEDLCSFFPFILRVRHLLNRLCVHLSPSHHHIQSPPCLFSYPPFLPPCFPPILLSVLPVSLLLTVLSISFKSFLSQSP